jgi:RND family efflux transporter MFP subunit
MIDPSQGERRTHMRLWRRSAIIGALGVLLAGASAAQPPPARVVYTEAREHSVRQMIELPGTVEARTTALVASEVDGLVEALRGREGQAVRKGQVLVHLRTADLELRLQAAEAGRREAAARLQQADADLERNRGLHDQGILSASQFGASRSERDAWQGRADQLSAEIARIRMDIDRSSVKAPFTGVVVAERCEIGEWIGQGDPVAELASLHDLEVLVEVPERYYSQLERGAEATMTFAALPGLEAAGEVSTIIPRANPQARTFPLKVRLANPEGRIGVGMLARVEFPAGASYRATVVPKDAVIIRGQERMVYRLKKDDTVEPISVETGAGVGSWIEIKSGLKPGTSVVTRGNERLRPGQSVVGEAGEYNLP